MTKIINHWERVARGIRAEEAMHGGAINRLRLRLGHEKPLPLPSGKYAERVLTADAIITGRPILPALHMRKRLGRSPHSLAGRIEAEMYFGRSR